MSLALSQLVTLVIVSLCHRLLPLATGETIHASEKQGGRSFRFFTVLIYALLKSEWIYRMSFRTLQYITFIGIIKFDYWTLSQYSVSQWNFPKKMMLFIRKQMHGPKCVELAASCALQSYSAFKNAVN